MTRRLYRIHQKSKSYFKGERGGGINKWIEMKKNSILSPSSAVSKKTKPSRTLLIYRWCRSAAMWGRVILATTGHEYDMQHNGGEDRGRGELGQRNLLKNNSGGWNIPKERKRWGGAGQREILFKKRTLISLRIFFFELDLVLVWIMILNIFFF